MPDKDLLLKKIEQVRTLIAELRELVGLDFASFSADMKTVRSAERSFQLLVDIAIDINGHIIVGLGKKTPDTYYQSFIELGRSGIIPAALAESLAPTASLRNILVHEYDFEDDYRKFYEAAKAGVPLYEDYCARILAFAEKETGRQRIP